VCRQYADDNKRTMARCVSKHHRERDDEELKTVEFLDIRGERVPKLGFGTWQLRGRECSESVQDALELGYRHIDTAQGYDNEELVGEGIRRSGVDRDDIFLVTKVQPSNFRRKDAQASTRESLRKLGTDYVDLLLLHWPNPDVPLSETLTALAELKDEGAVKHIGVSNFPPSMVLEAREFTPIFANQVEYHPYLGQPKLTEQAVELDYMLTAYSPLAKGKIPGDPKLADIGEAHGKSAAQVALRWLIQQDHVATIPKAASAEHRRGNLEIFDFELSSEEMQQIHDMNRNDRLIDPAGGPDWER
jgi:diketogulonate reductase-like aldo/keto reductase